MSRLKLVSSREKLDNNFQVKPNVFKSLFKNSGILLRAILFGFSQHPLFMLLFLGVAFGMMTLFYHCLAPENWHFLSHQQVEYIKTMFFGALVASAIKGLYKNG